MNRLLAVGIFAALLVFSSFAQAACTSPAGVEGQAVYNKSYHIYEYCNGTNWVGFGGIDPAGGGSGCTSPTGVEAQMIYNGSYHVYEFCDGTNWMQVGGYASGLGCPNPGNNCSDGTIYIGLSPDGNLPMYATPADAGGMPWNNGNTSGYVSSNYYPTQPNDMNSGKSNSNAIYPSDADSGTSGFQPNQAVTYCFTLTTGNKNDWYLPSPNEMELFYTNRASISGYNSGYNYWTSREENQYDAVSMWSGDGTTNNYHDKSDSSVRVWCVRKGNG